MAKVVHMTTVHSPHDPRVFAKECATLVAAGHDVTLVVPAARSEVQRGVKIKAVPPPSGRLYRMTVTAFLVFCEARRLRADVYHFHDPELIGWGLLLRGLGHKVVYDIHEDYATAIGLKRYLPVPVRRLVARIYGRAEKFLARTLAIVLAEKYYQRRLPSGVTILNYPERPPEAPPDVAFDPASRRLLYTGNVTEDRGALIQAQILNYRSDLHLVCVGRCPGHLAKAMSRVAGNGADRLHIVGIDRYVPFDIITKYYQKEKWLCGLALFRDSPHYREKEPTKLFEYMLAGLPVLSSSLPVWKLLIEGEGVGLCVPPNDPHAISTALDLLIAHPVEAAAMGRRGQKLVLERLNWTVEGQKLVALYEEMLRQNPR